MSTQEKVGDGKFVSYTYKLYDEKTGEMLFEVPADRPDWLIYGLSHDVVPGLLVAMKGLAAGDKFSVTLPPEAAFGEKFADNILELDKEIFMQDGKLADAVKVDAMLPMMTEEGFQIRGKVLDVTADKVKMDFNHPFAGLTVKYDGEVLDVHTATPEEIAQVQQHGCGCGCGEEGCCGEEGHCGDHCHC